MPFNIFFYFCHRIIQHTATISNTPWQSSRTTILTHLYKRRFRISLRMGIWTINTPTRSERRSRKTVSHLVLGSGRPEPPSEQVCSRFFLCHWLPHVQGLMAAEWWPLGRWWRNKAGKITVFPGNIFCFCSIFNDNLYWCKLNRSPDNMHPEGGVYDSKKSLITFAL